MHPEVSALIEAWHWMYFETDLLFERLSEENLHRRPGPNLIAISEHCAHVARSEASIVERGLFGRPAESWADCLFREEPFGWPPTLLESPVHPELLQMTVADVHAEYVKQHERCLAVARGLLLPPEHEFVDAWDRVTSLRDRLRIAAYHVGYHAGQIYSVRHMLGEETPEN